jgi:NhaP-type Na+/H+ or K+/H+ antiporter
MDVREIQGHGEAFESFKRTATQSLLWGCLGFFLLGVMVGLMLAR